MGIYVKPSKDKKYVWLVWIFQNFETEGRRTLHTVHASRKSAILTEGSLPRNETQYYSIEKKELSE